jgi:hypothetical protein
LPDGKRCFTSDVILSVDGPRPVLLPAWAGGDRVEADLEGGRSVRARCSSA